MAIEANSMARHVHRLNLFLRTIYKAGDEMFSSLVQCSPAKRRGGEPHMHTTSPVSDEMLSMEDDVLTTAPASGSALVSISAVMVRKQRRGPAPGDGRILFTLGYT